LDVRCENPCYPCGILHIIMQNVHNSQAQQNRASEIGGNLHTDGSITRREHAIRMVSTLNRNRFYSL